MSLLSAIKSVTESAIIRFQHQKLQSGKPFPWQMACQVIKYSRPWMYHLAAIQQYDLFMEWVGERGKEAIWLMECVPRHQCDLHTWRSNGAYEHDCLDGSHDDVYGSDAVSSAWLTLYVLSHSREQNIYSHYTSFLHIDIAQVVEIRSHVRQELTYST